MGDVMRIENTERPIFVVGGSRSGTSLLAAMLNAHSQIACGSETQILRTTSSSKLISILSDDCWPNRAVDHLMTITLAEQRVVDNFGSTRGELNEYLRGCEPSVKALFEAICLVYARKQGKPRWAEKTPRHLLYLNQIRKAFPKGLVIRIVRDPRDSALSMRQLPWASNDFLPNFYLCCQWFGVSNQFFERDSLSLTVVYEDLIKQPENELRKICVFIGEEFEGGMLETARSGQSVVTKNEPWKKQVTGVLDPSRLLRWKRELANDQVRASELIGRYWLSYFSYECESKARSVFYLCGFERGQIEDMQDDILYCANEGVALQEVRDVYSKNCLVLYIQPKMRSKKMLKAIWVLLVRRLGLRRTLLLFGDGCRGGRPSERVIDLLANRRLGSLRDII